MFILAAVFVKVDADDYIYFALCGKCYNLIDTVYQVDHSSGQVTVFEVSCLLITWADVGLTVPNNFGWGFWSVCLEVNFIGGQWEFTNIVLKLQTVATAINYKCLVLASVRLFNRESLC